MYQCQDCGLIFDEPNIDTGVDKDDKLVDFKECIKCGSTYLKEIL